MYSLVGRHHYRESITGTSGAVKCWFISMQHMSQSTRGEKGFPRSMVKHGWPKRFPLSLPLHVTSRFFLLKLSSRLLIFALQFFTYVMYSPLCHSVPGDCWDIFGIFCIMKKPPQINTLETSPYISVQRALLSFYRAGQKVCGIICQCQSVLLTCSKLEVLKKVFVCELYVIFYNGKLY